MVFASDPNFSNVCMDGKEVGSEWWQTGPPISGWGAIPA